MLQNRFLRAKKQNIYPKESFKIKDRTKTKQKVQYFNNITFFKMINIFLQSVLSSSVWMKINLILQTSTQESKIIFYQTIFELKMTYNTVQQYRVEFYCVLFLKL